MGRELCAFLLRTQLRRPNCSQLADSLPVLSGTSPLSIPNGCLTRKKHHRATRHALASQQLGKSVQEGIKRYEFDQELRRDTGVKYDCSISKGESKHWLPRP